MKSDYYNVSLLDVNEELNLKETLNEFVNSLEKNTKLTIHYVGMDIIGEKNYERFLIHNGGFFEVLMDEPAAMSGHFPDKKSAENFAKSLKKTIKKFHPKNKFLQELVEVNSLRDNSISVSKWNEIKGIKGL